MGQALAPRSSSPATMPRTPPLLFRRAINLPAQRRDVTTCKETCHTKKVGVSGTIKQWTQMFPNHARRTALLPLSLRTTNCDRNETSSNSHVVLNQGKKPYQLAHLENHVEIQPERTTSPHNSCIDRPSECVAQLSGFSLLTWRPRPEDLLKRKFGLHRGAPRTTASARRDSKRAKPSANSARWALSSWTQLNSSSTLANRRRARSTNWATRIQPNANPQNCNGGFKMTHLLLRGQHTVGWLRHCTCLHSPGMDCRRD